MKQLSDEEIFEAFDGDFGEVTFDHKPTEEEVFLIKLKLVARLAEQEILKQVVKSIQVALDSEWLDDVKLGLIKLLQKELQEMVKG